jgi:hypothetical protein
MLTKNKVRVDDKRKGWYLVTEKGEEPQAVEKGKQ